MEVRTSASDRERAWWKKFRAVVKDMPSTMEVLVSATGQLSATDRGALRKAFEARGDGDNVTTFFDCTPLEDCGFKDHSGSL